MKPLKIMFLAPHLSTGGMPAFLLKRILALRRYTTCEIFVVEYECHSHEYVVQRSKIIELMGPMNFHSLKWENKCDLFNFIDYFNPDIIHIDEMSERLNFDMIKELYKNDRTYRIVETCHDVSFNPENKIYTPDAYAFCTPYHLMTFKNNNGYKHVIEYPIDKKDISETLKKQSREFLEFDSNKKHVINVGLWTPGKNQAEGIEIAKNYPKHMFHFIGNQAENFKDYWEPLMIDLPSNVKVWRERQDVEIFMQAADIFMFNSTNECNPIVLKEAISYGLPIIAKKLPVYMNMYDKIIGQKSNYTIPVDNTSYDFAINHMNLYKHVLEAPSYVSDVVDTYKISHHFVIGPFVEIIGSSDSDFRVEFWDNDKLIHHNTIKANHWVRANREYFTNWTIRVYKDEKLVYGHNLSYIDKKVYIAFDSKSLGDTIAWFPYVEEFRYKHKCKLIVSTHFNFLFKDMYPYIEFVEPGAIVENLFGMYKLGWFYDKNKEPVLPNTIPLQQAATNILGLEYEEKIPLITLPEVVEVDKKYVTIATESTAGCKLWPKENWQELVNHLVNSGYDVINTSLNCYNLDNCTTLDDKTLENTMKCIYNSEFFIGLSSGLSWLAWALLKEVIMISNFTNAEHEFTCYRPTVKSVCNSCWNNANFKFDKGDWNWCPIHKNTDKQFECQKAISVEMIIKKINVILKH